MSEIQNRIVRLIQAREGQDGFADRETRRRLLMTHAMAIFEALGGSNVELAAIQSSAATQEQSVSRNIGEILFDLAAIGHLSDIDMIQAAYNLIDLETRQ